MVFIGVHVGAGYHAMAHREMYLDACRVACLESMNKLKDKCSAIDGVIDAITALEDNSWTNAGFGSNLNSNGLVECDASLMNGSDLKWGAVGALQGIKNPIKAAELVLKGQYKELPLGLIPPNILVGGGATLFAAQNGCISSDLRTDKSKERYNKYKRRLESVVIQEENGSHLKHSRLDTVGAICVDYNGNVASGVSSGGIALKMSGRVGQAAMMGCGVWAQHNIAVTTTGIGEHLIKTLLAKECANRLLRTSDGIHSNSLRLSFKHDFIESPFLQSIPIDERLAGVLALVYDKESNQTELLWGHSTPSMCLGYMSSDLKKPKAMVSELSAESKPGISFIIEGKLIK